MKQPFPAVVLPFHPSLSGYRVVAHGRGAAITMVEGQDVAFETHRAFFHGAMTYARLDQDVYLLVRGDEAMAWKQSAPGDDQTPAGRQRVLPGAGSDNGASFARKRISEPMRPAKPQAACDIGLFDDSARSQSSLF